jgi:hypothetical protein
VDGHWGKLLGINNVTPSTLTFWLVLLFDDKVDAKVWTSNKPVIKHTIQKLRSINHQQPQNKI